MANKTFKVRKLRSGEIRIDFTGTPKQNLAAFSALTKALGCPMQPVDTHGVAAAGLELSVEPKEGAASRGVW